MRKINKKKSQHAAKSFAKKLVENQRDIDPEISKIVQKRFWDML
jgi:hypothetical protein